MRRQVLGDLPFSEALQAGRIGLWRAILGFDPSRGFAFSTYAWPAIQRRVWRAVETHAQLHSSPPTEPLLPPLENGSAAVPAPSPDPERAWEAAQVQRALHALVRRLPPRLRYVIVARRGSNGHRPLSYRQIGPALGLCGERARRLHTEALVWPRHPAHSHALRSLLGRKRPTRWPNAGCVGGEGAMTTDLTPVETRAQDADFVVECSTTGLEDRLPLVWPAPPDVPPSPKNAYRSHYVYPGREASEDPEARDYLSDFEIVLYLVDFEPSRPVLARLLGWTSARGWKPFDPVSIFLLLGWQITDGWNRAETLREIERPRYADLARRFGFEDGVFPTEGGLRYWLTTIGDESATRKRKNPSKSPFNSSTRSSPNR